MNLADVMAFGKWEAYRIVGSPYVGNIEKVYLTNPDIAIILDRHNKRIGFVTNRLRGTDNFFLPQKKPNVEKPVYYAVYSPIEDWIKNTNGYAPRPGTESLELVHRLVPSHFTILAKSEDESEFTHFPLSYRQMLLHGSRLAGKTIEKYIQSLPPEQQERAKKSFELDLPAVSLTQPALSPRKQNSV